MYVGGYIQCQSLGGWRGGCFVTGIFKEVSTAVSVHFVQRKRQSLAPRFIFHHPVPDFISKRLAYN
jgi:3'-phosphoadenosine 5'-phosphosulfate sulfotransferase